MSQTSTPFDTRAFRNALGRFPTGVTVVTARTPEGETVGLTVSSFNSVSLAPPLVVWSLGSHLPFVAAFERCEYYAINVLAEDQQALSQHFASRVADKFAGLDTREGLGGVPLLEGCCASFECRNTIRHAGGDHIVLIGEVVRFSHDDAPPLVFHGGTYRRLSP